jgi:transcriptional regulator with XRE-family HTH domain
MLTSVEVDIRGIKQLRLRAQLDQGQLAERIGCHRSDISKLEGYVDRGGVLDRYIAAVHEALTEGLTPAAEGSHQ